LDALLQLLVQRPVAMFCLERETATRIVCAVNVSPHEGHRIEFNTSSRSKGGNTEIECCCASSRCDGRGYLTVYTRSLAFPTRSTMVCSSYPQEFIHDNLNVYIASAFESLFLLHTLVVEGNLPISSPTIWVHTDVCR